MKNRKLWIGMPVMTLVFGLMLVGCPVEPDESDKPATYTVWTGRFSYSGSSSDLIFGGLEDGYYHYRELTKTASDWQRMNNFQNNNHPRYEWTEDQIYSYLISVGFGSTEARRESEWLILVSHGIIVTRSGAILHAILKTNKTNVWMGFEWEIHSTNGNIIITGYQRSGGVIKIPAEIDGIPVRYIGQGAFRDKNIIDITLPDSVTSIGNNAFWKNNLIAVTIPDSVTFIGEGAFGFNKLTNVTIGSSVVTIGKWAFEGNFLTDIVIPDSVTEIGSASFAGNSLTSATIGNGVVYIREDAFLSNKLQNITIPDSVKYIEDGAFAVNELTDIVIPDSVTDIGYSAFHNNKLTEITIGSGIKEIWGQVFSRNQLTSVTIPDHIRAIRNKTFENNPLTDITIGADVTLDDVPFGNNFENTYNTYGKAAGTYTRPSTSSIVWTKTE